MSDAVILLNTALEGRYEIEHELGAGGMATVHLAACLLCLALATPGQTLAQDSGTLEAGSRVRVSSQVHGLFRAVGVVLDVSTDTVVIDLDDGQSALPIARSDITALDVAVGRKSRRAEGIVIGILGGAAVGFGIGFAQKDDPTYSPAQVGGVLAVLGALVGAGVGNRLGSSMFTDDWQPVEFSGFELAIAPMVGADRMGFRIMLATRGDRASRSRHRR